jgi:hypothetical protein
MTAAQLETLKAKLYTAERTMKKAGNWQEATRLRDCADLCSSVMYRVARGW